MITSPRFLKSAFITAAMFGSAAAFAADLPHWQVLPDKSNIEWTAMYAGKPVAGSFKDFSSDVVFDPDQLDATSVTVKIDTGKVMSDDKDAEQSLPTVEWFDSTRFPQAVFEAKTFRHIDAEKYEAEGTLTFGEKKNTMVLPFTVHFYDDNETTPGARYAQVTAETNIKRTDYGIGKGDWAKTDVVGDDVKITINLKAKQPEGAKP